MNHTILLVDDRDDLRQSLAENFQLRGNYSVLEADRGSLALMLVEQHPEIQCIILDHDFTLTEPHITGLDVLRRLGDLAPHIPVIMMSGVQERRVRVAVDAIKHHAVDFMEIPFPTKVLIERVEEMLAEHAHGAHHAREILCRHGFISVSPVMTDVCERALNAATNDWSVLIVGETGVGKDTLARAIHQIGPRNAQPFKELNCPGISRELFNSELFGHRKGSFTGAVENKIGILEAAQGGTVFLNELGDMPLDMQVQLNQAIEHKEFRRVGETHERSFDARVIAATKYGVREAVRQKRLREDLQYRFKEIIEIPPLRKHAADVEPIVRHFVLEHLNIGTSRPVKIEDDALTLLQRQPWVGNVRQLCAVVERAAARVDDHIITVASIGRELRREYHINDRREITGDLDGTLEGIRREYIVEALTATKGNVSEAARRLGYKTKEGLKYWLDLLDIDPKEF